MPTERSPQAQRALRLACGTALCLTVSFGLALPIPFMAPVLALMLLVSLNQPLSFKAGLSLILVALFTTGVGLLLIRKAGKLPGERIAESYALEYGEATLEVHTGQLAPGTRVLLVDDVLATGGTVEAIAGLVEQLGGVVVGVNFVIELSFLGGRSRLENYELYSLITY